MSSTSRPDAAGTAPDRPPRDDFSENDVGEPRDGGPVRGAAIAGAPANSLSVALASRLVLIALVGALAPASGAHFNPAVTIALASVGRFPWRIAPVHLGAQLLGAVAGAAATWLTLGRAARQVAHLGATHPAQGIGDGRALIVEASITFLLVFVIISVASSDASPVVAAVLIGGPSTGGAVNPVRALGPMILDLDLTSAWVYLVGPLVGGLAAAQLYVRVVGRAGAPARAGADVGRRRRGLRARPETGAHGPAVSRPPSTTSPTTSRCRWSTVTEPCAASARCGSKPHSCAAAGGTAS